jgi:hypothetical protein
MSDIISSNSNNILIGSLSLPVRFSLHYTLLPPLSISPTLSVFRLVRLASLLLCIHEMAKKNISCKIRGNHKLSLSRARTTCMHARHRTQTHNMENYTEFRQLEIFAQKTSRTHHRSCRGSEEVGRGRARSQSTYYQDVFRADGGAVCLSFVDNCQLARDSNFSLRLAILLFLIALRSGSRRKLSSLAIYTEDDTAIDMSDLAPAAVSDVSDSSDKINVSKERAPINTALSHDDLLFPFGFILFL